MTGFFPSCHYTLETDILLLQSLLLLFAVLESEPGLMHAGHVLYHNIASQPLTTDILRLPYFDRSTEKQVCIQWFYFMLLCATG